VRNLAWLSAAQQKRLGAALTSYEVARDQLIFADDGGSILEVFILLSGAARLSCIGVKRGRTAIAILPPGVIALPPALTHFTGQFRCEAVRHSRVAKIPRDAFVEILLGARVLHFDRVAKLLFGGLDSLLTRYPGFIGLDLRGRVAMALLELGATFGARDARGIVLTITPTQQDLADLVGASRPKISLVLSEFARRRAIYREGRHLALVTSRLEEMAQVRLSVAYHG
jgi:CRP-like cAMP-binding protein